MLQLMLRWFCVTAMPMIRNYKALGLLPPPADLYPLTRPHMTPTNLEWLLDSGWVVDDEFMVRAVERGWRALIMTLRNRGVGWGRVTLLDAAKSAECDRDFLQWLIVETDCPK